jgi:hypothetical protein
MQIFFIVVSIIVTHFITNKRKPVNRKLCLNIQINYCYNTRRSREVKDEKNIKYFFNDHFLSGFFRRCFGRRKDCAINRAWLFRLKLQGQDRFYPEKD